MFNIYGTSEVSSWASIYEVSEADFSSHDQLADSDWVPIGFPLSKTCVEVRSERNEVVKEGVGKIWIGSEDRKCYVDDDDGTSTTMRFTGDIGKVKNGNIYYCGRNDNKIKHNGQLIDLDILCMIVNKKCDLCFCLFEHSTLTKREELYLFIKPSTQPPRNMEADILNFIKKHLSSAYTPENIIFVKKFSLTPHGKIDKHKLKNHPFVVQTQSSTYTINDYLSHSWNSILGFDVNTKINPSDNFVTCGGDSFTAVYLFNNIAKYINDRKPYVVEDIGKLLDCILRDTYDELSNYVDTILNEPNNIEGNIQGLQNNTIVFHESGDNTHTHHECSHFIAYQKQARITKCYCYTEASSHRDLVPTYNDSPDILVLTESWHYNLGKCIDASPLVVINNEFKDGIVYIGSHSHLMVAVTLNKGELVWENTLGDRIESSATMCYDGKFIAVGCYDGYLYFLEGNSGDIHWKYFTGDTVKSSPVCDQNNGIVIVGSHRKKVHALNVMLKECLWVYRCDSSCFSSPLCNQQLECVYVALLSGQMTSLDIKTGSVLWKTSLSKPIFSSPCLCRNIIVVGCVDCYLYAMNFSGEIVWKFETNGPIFSSPVYLRGELSKEEDFIVFGSNDHSLYCLNTDGKLIWKYHASSSIYSAVGVLVHKISSEKKYFLSKVNKPRIPDTKNISDETQVNVRSNVIDHNGKSKHKLERTHETDNNGKRKRSSKQLVNCSSYGAFIVAASTSGEMFVLTDEGLIVASYKFPHEIYSSPVVVNDTIIVGCRDDNVYSLKLSLSSDEIT